MFTLNADPEDIRREEFQGREFLVAPVVPIRAMNLDGGYVPTDHVAKSAPAWNGTPVTLNHPRNENGQLVSANSPDVAEKTWLGHLFNNEPANNGEETQGEVWVDIENARELGGEAEQILDMMENGDPLSVSTSYFGDKLPAGEYDGEHREEVVGNLRPDHLALLPNKEGRCSVEDGCVAGPQAANEAGESQLMVATQADDPETSGEEPAGNESEDGGNGIVKAIRDGLSNATLSVERRSTNESAESDTDDTMTEREQMVNTLVEEHGFNEDSLEGMGETCLERTYNSFVEDDGQDDPAEEQTANEEDDDSEDDTVEVSANELDELIDERVEERLEANQQAQKRESIVEDIVANTDEYEADDLEETPVSVLKNIREDVTTEEQSPGANFAAQPGASADAGGSDDADDFPTLTASNRVEGDD